jgi:hypothetical protein
VKVSSPGKAERLKVGRLKGWKAEKGSVLERCNGVAEC